MGASYAHKVVREGNLIPGKTDDFRAFADKPLRLCALRFAAKMVQNATLRSILTLDAKNPENRSVSARPAVCRLIPATC
jgi:hypothetical protein